MNVRTSMMRALALGALVAVGAPALAAQAARAAQVSVYEASIRDLQLAMSSGRATSVQLVEQYLARIAAYDRGGAQLNSMIRLNPRARAEAAALDRERRAGRVRGELHGIPIVLKDNFDTYDMPTSAGSIALASHRPPDDAFIVKRLRDAGAVIIGKANMHELAAGVTNISSLGGQTRNPYDPRRCPGGSSGGTGVAVAASFATVGWGSDTCGSIRIPSAFGSLFGLRPTTGSVSRDGVVPLASTQDVTGPLARTVTDLAIALDYTVGYDPADSVTHVLRDRSLAKFVDALDASALRGARIGVLTNFLANSDQDIIDTLRSATRTMSAAGAEVVDVRIADFDSLMAGSGVIGFETKFHLAEYLKQSPNPPVSGLTEILNRGLYHDALEARLRRPDTVQSLDTDAYRKAIAKQAVVRARIVALLDSLKLDVLLYPTMNRRPAFIGDPQPGGSCQLSSNTGLPALSIPAGFTNDGLPVGVEILGRPFADQRLVSLGYAFEQLGPRRRAPSTTPMLVRGVAPAPRAFTQRVRGSGVIATGRFSMDPTRSELTYDVRATGARVGDVTAVLLERVEPSGRRTVHRFLGPETGRSTGRLFLNGADRRALDEGRLQLAVYSTAQSAPVGTAVLQ